MGQIITIDEFKKIRLNLKNENKIVVFTNGCFDLLHAGHVDYLNKAKTFGDILVIGINSDRSVKKIKGINRPIINEKERAYIISNLANVDYVILFDEGTPENLIKTLSPDVLVKGADWSKDEIIGAEYVESNGGRIERVDFVCNQSTSKIIQTILDRHK